LHRVFSEPGLGVRVAQRALKRARRQYYPARAADEYEDLFLSLI
jgi:hypothetical protein